MSRSVFGVVFVTIAVVTVLQGAPQRTRPPDGLREHPPRAFALTGARLFVEPDRIVPSGTLVVRDGKLTAVGAGVVVPPDVAVLDYSGKTIYAGFIDSYGEVTLPALPEGAPGAYWNDEVTPQRGVAAAYRPDSDLDKTLRSQGIVARLVGPAAGIVKGTSALVETGDGDVTRILSPRVALHIHLTASRGWGSTIYPNSPMGAVALARQAFYDSAWYQDAWRTWQGNTALPVPERNTALAALAEFSAGHGLVVAEAADELFHLRADRFAREFGLRLVVRGSGKEYRRLDAIRQSGRPVVLPLDFPPAPDVSSPEAALDASLERLLHWDIAPENPARVVRAGIRVAFTSEGLKDRATFQAALRHAVRRGLPPSAALRSLTTVPAEVYGLPQLGSLATGKHASFVVTDGDLFEKETKILETWVGGKRYRVTPVPPRQTAGDWRLELGPHGARPAVLFLHIGSDEKTATVRPDKTLPGFAGAVKVSRLERLDVLLSGSFPGASFSSAADAEASKDGVARFSITFDTISTTAGARSGVGQLVWPGGAAVSLRALEQPLEEVSDASAQDVSATVSDAVADAATDASSDGEPAGESAKAAEPDAKAAEEKTAASVSQPATFEVNYPLGAYGRSESAKPPGTVLIQGATVWTCGAAGVLERGSVLFGDGKILAVGTEVEVPPGALIVDGKGLHVTPGLIDCHSHIATDGGVNESGQAVTAEVRIGDFINSDDIRIFWQLGGGVTCANILHGSANPIGGQNQVIKLRWGSLGGDMKFAAAPAGIKFALGENVKQSNWGDEHTSRYPQTRMGVEQLFRDEFSAASEYLERWREWEAERSGLPPRRDLELEAIGEIVEGKRWIHCHSYRQDEILALLRVLEEFDITIGTLQHILEGYKVADAMKKHGAMASTFSDWWGYKFEVYDAIPYAGALMHDAGVVVSFNSDDGELGRHLNQEAAKAIRYGGVKPEEALLFVTLNPAKQLRIDAHVGSLEAGKDADLVLWNGPPLSNYARCVETWIDGRKYFDRDDAQAQAEKAREMRRTLIQKILITGASTVGAGESRPDPAELWPREDRFCRFHHSAGHDVEAKRGGE
jgi:imidazolonepropionase-like amidohydrolase